MEVMQIERLLEAAIKREAGDLHLSVGIRPVLRQHGRLLALETKELELSDVVELLKQLTATDPKREQDYMSRGVSDFAFGFKEARFRVNICRAQGKPRITIRRLPNKVLTVEEIGLPTALLPLINQARGLVLVTGPTGSGKTTTLAALISRILEKGGRHVYAIEQPTEYILTHGKGLLTQREVPTDTVSFEAAVIDALRANPDVIVVGEMRELSTIRAALTAAETGHLVLATLHTTSAPGTVNRIIDAFPQGEQEQIRSQLSTSILGILCQQLLPRQGGGQVAAFEFLKVNLAIANLIREQKTEHLTSSIQTGKNHGMQLLDDNLFQLCKQGIVSSDDALAKANDPASLTSRLKS